MIIRSTAARFPRQTHRLDAHYFLSPGTQAAERLETLRERGYDVVPFGSSESGFTAFAPSRFRRVYAVPGEDATPYLRPYDVFEYLPKAADLLSAGRSLKLDQYRVHEGDLLQTCSGRNLGPAVYVDSDLAQFVMSHDIIRLRCADTRFRLYVLAYLSTPTGQAMLRRDKSGSVIDHISVSHLNAISVPVLPQVMDEVVDMMAQAVSARETGRAALRATVAAYEQPWQEALRWSAPKRGWSVKRGALVGRLDAAPHRRELVELQDLLRQQGAVRVADVADVRKPAGRYKTYYVDQVHGLPILSGRQLLQSKPINLQFISTRSFSDPGRYELTPDMIVFPADGRAEESLGEPACVTDERVGWLASGHVGRLVPADSADLGWLFAAFASEQVQQQVKATACGSVVDALYEGDVGSVLLPKPHADDINGSVVDAWAQMSLARLREEQAVGRLESALADASGEQQLAV